MTTKREEALEMALRHVIEVAEEARREWDEAPSGMRAGKLLIALCGGCKGYRQDIDDIHELLALPENEPDYVYDADNWEVTYPWSERFQLTDCLPPGDVFEMGTLVTGPTLWASNVIVTRDDYGDPDETEPRWFRSEEEAKTASIPVSELEAVGGKSVEHSTPGAPK